jgi:hypothetical protein
MCNSCKDELYYKFDFREHPAMLLTDAEIQSKLRERGYIVPLMVMRTWSRHHVYSVRRNLLQVERWLLHTDSQPGRKPKFPQFLAPFDVNIQRYNSHDPRLR